jgi:tRNA(Ile)-lysidine synthase
VPAVVRLTQKVSGFLKRHSMPLGPTVVAVSGGPDSMALLRALLEIRDKQLLVVAHLNHQLRGSDSDADEAFVRELHVHLVSGGVANLSLWIEHVDVAAAARQAHDNLEAAARRLRYDWLAHVARETGCSLVMTGHTADDQAETVLHRLLRGTGLRGLRSIAAYRPLVSGVTLVRPLLDVRRADVLRYLAELPQSYREDRSNADRRFTRNHIRHELLPYLAQHYNPSIVSTLCRVAEQAAEGYSRSSARAQKLLQTVERPRAGSLLVFDRQKLASVSRPLIRESFRLAWAREGWPMREMGRREWDRVADVVLGNVTAIDLPGRIRARAREHVVQIGPVL